MNTSESSNRGEGSQLVEVTCQVGMKFYSVEMSSECVGVHDEMSCTVIVVWYSECGRRSSGCVSCIVTCCQSAGGRAASASAAAREDESQQNKHAAHQEDRTGEFVITRSHSG